ncbi:MAG: NTP transferase domain-containing protein [Clostridium sp.]|nr:NTP transferase domain-containing protein [Clostridium sp.]
MNDGIVIQARSGSTRMPAKILRPFDGQRRIIDIILDNIGRLCPETTVVVATTTNPADDTIARIAAEHGAGCFRGPEEDVLARFIGAADRFGFDRIVRVCSDNPFLQADTFLTLLEANDRSGADYTSFAFPDGRPTIKSHLGLFAEVARADALRCAASETPEKLYHEHVTNYLYSNPGRFTIDLIPLPETLKERTDLRLTLDTPSDFALLSELYRRHRDETSGSLDALIALVDSDSRYGAIMKENIEKNSK